MIEFTLPIAPTAQQRPRFSRRGAHKSRTQQAHEAELDCQLLCHVPDKPLEGLISVEFTAYMPIPKSTPKRARERRTDAKIPHGRKPDIDNLEKQLLDRLTKLGFWRDDGQVWRVLKEKVYSDRPRWKVRIEETPDVIFPLLAGQDA